MKILILLITGFCLISTAHLPENVILKETNSPELKIDEPTAEVKVILEKYASRWKENKVLPTDVTTEELQTLNAYLQSITGNACTTESWESCHYCAGPIMNPTADDKAFLRMSFLWRTSCGNSCVVYTRPAPASGDGC